MARSALAAVGWFSNIYFFEQSGYFDSAAPTKPLLHTWSLAVEMQFYVGAALVVAAVARLRGAPASRVILWSCFAAALVGTFLASVIALPKQPSAVFFLTPFRLWEFLVGAALAFVPAVQKDGHAQALAIAGLGAILGSAVWISPDAPFPGLLAAPSVLGAAAIITASGGSASSWTRRLLESAMLQALGRYSYSLYLAHWPIVVFWFGLGETSPDPLETVALFAASFIAAGILFHTVERPTRALWGRGGPVLGAAGARLQGRPLVLAGLLLASVAVVSVLSSAQSNGWRWRWADSEVRLALSEAFAKATQDYYAVINPRFTGAEAFDPQRHDGLPCSFDDANTPQAVLDCLRAQTTGATVLLIGDSNGNDALHALRRAFPSTPFAMIHQSSCGPAEYLRADQTRCFEDLGPVLHALAADSHLTAAILASSYDLRNIEELSETFALLKQLGLPVAVVGPGVRLTARPERILAEHYQGQTDAQVNSLFAAHVARETGAVDTRLRAIAAEAEALYVDRRSPFCEGAPDHCRTTEPATALPYMWDTNHLTVHGIARLAEGFQANSELRAFIGQSASAATTAE